MDRLVVGDVGFGKTEVAMRAAFVAAMSGMQVAVICPTTLLARQHYRSFAERFRGFPISVRPLSRFVSTKDANATREAMARWRRWISSWAPMRCWRRAIRFKNLGLMVIDEEQHFGVTHKERLKEMRSEVHVLTLTATPIPRTLQLSLTGVRDLSIIATPPVDRLAIRTYVSANSTPSPSARRCCANITGAGSLLCGAADLRSATRSSDFLKTHVPEVTLCRRPWPAGGGRSG